MTYPVILKIINENISKKKEILISLVRWEMTEESGFQAKNNCYDSVKRESSCYKIATCLNKMSHILPQIYQRNIMEYI